MLELRVTKLKNSTVLEDFLVVTSSVAADKQTKGQNGLEAELRSELEGWPFLEGMGEHLRPAPQNQLWPRKETLRETNKQTHTLLVGMSTGAATMENGIEVPRKI